MGSGSSIATIEPMDGMKLSRKARVPKTTESSRPRPHSTSAVTMPVAAEVVTFVAR